NISKDFESSWTDISQAYGLTNGDWSGDAANTFSTWFDKNLTPAKESLKALLDELATQLDNVGNAVLALDIAGVTFTVVSAVFLCTLMAWWIASLGTLTPALTAAGVTYALGLLAWLAVVGTTIAAFVSATGAVETKANDLAAKLWKDSESQEQARIALIKSLEDSDNWQHNSDLDK
ncbi:MAG TPA: WXG100 family type VII secretion target, partial [Actinopolymorphaceae bacterium]